MKKRRIIIAFGFLLISFFCQIKLMAQATSNPLFHIENMLYQGAFYIPGETYGESNSNYTSGTIEYNSENNSLYLAGFNLHGAIGEFAIPEIVNSTDLNQLNTTTNLQPFRRILNLTPDGNPQGLDRISGIKLIDGKLVVNAIEYYDAPANNTKTTMVLEDPDDIATGTINGYYSLEGAAHAGDWISPVPDEWQELLGGTYLSGSSNKWAINGRCVMGISAFIFDFIQDSIIPTTAVLDFNLSNPMYADYSSYASTNYNLVEINGETFSGHTFEDADAVVGTNDLWTEESEVSYGFIIPGTRTYFTIGASGGHNSGIGYKATQNNGHTCGGPCAYDADDYYNYYWLWDVNDLLAVKNNTLMPYEVRPYEYGIFDAPFQTDILLNTDEFHPIRGGSYDPETGMLYLTIYDGGSTGTYERAPAIAVYQILNAPTVKYYVSSTSTSTNWTAAHNIETPCNVSTAFANAIAGDSVIFLEGTYSGGEYISGLQGSENNWITILAETEHGVIIQGGSNSWQLSDPCWVKIEGFIFEHQTGNGLNIDDEGTFETPADHIIISNCIFRDMSASGNNDLLKLSGVDNFQVADCEFLNGAGGGSGIDMVGCHNGLIHQNRFENMGSNAIQMKGGTQHITVERNFFKNCGARTLNLGGSTGLAYFRPQDATFEAADLYVYSNIFIGSEAPIAYVGCTRVKVVNNTFYLPERWVVRILQETVDPDRFISCGDNYFENNIIYQGNISTETNVGPNTRPQSFTYSNNFWYNYQNTSWSGPSIPVTDPGLIINQDPSFTDASSEDFSIADGSPAVGIISGDTVPVYDFSKNIYNNPRSAGAIEGDPLVLYTLNVNAVNGYILKEPNLESYEEGQKVRLITRPAVGYKFSHWEGDASGNRLIADVVMNGNKTVTAVFDEWVPPIGIPAPEFGIFETYRMYDTVANRNPSLTYTQNAEGGFYTHYVDPTHPLATNSGNNYGTASRPRVSLPSATYIPEGSVIEIAGNTTISGQLILRVTGTMEKPIFIRGTNPENQVGLTGGELYISSEYVIIENIARPDESIFLRSFLTGTKAYRVSVRNCLTRKMGAVSWDGGSADEVVFYGNYVNGYAFDPAGSGYPEMDGIGGIGIHLGSNKVWIIDNDITLAGGDASGAGHAANYTARNYYIGRNVMYTCGENAVDIKEVDVAIVSENTMFNFQGWSAGSDGTAIVLHYGPINSPRNVWLLYNEIFECSDKGIQVGGDQMYDVHIIGNVIHDIKNPEGTANGYKTWSSMKVYLVNNTFYNVDNILSSSIGSSGSELLAYNNIFSNVTPGGYHLYVNGSDHMAHSIFDNNLFYQPNGTAQINWGGSNYTLEQFKTNTGKGNNCIEANPLFRDTINYDFSLQNNSPACNSGIVSSLYALYESNYNLDIAVERNHVSRPQGSSWDMGAFEYQTPAVFKNLTIANQTFPGGSTKCFGATDTIVIAGNTSTVSFASGSWVTLIAGQTIQLKPGTHIQQGSYVNASITPNGEFCDQIQQVALSAKTFAQKSDNINKPDSAAISSEQTLRVFPNPNNGYFSIQVKGFNHATPIIIYNALGENIHNDIINFEKTIDISYVQKGLYFIKTFSENKQIIQKVLIR